MILKHAALKGSVSLSTRCLSYWTTWRAFICDLSKIQVYEISMDIYGHTVFGGSTALDLHIPKHLAFKG